MAVSFLLGALPQFLTPPLPDISWLLYMARRMLAGARPYVDLVEVNPPLIVWLNLVPAGLADLLRLPAVFVYRVMVVGAALASFLLCAGMLAALREPSAPAARRLLLLLVSVALLALAGPDFGEREHLLLILTLPYVFLVAARLEGGMVGVGVASVIGLAAGLGIALKPYFALLPLLLEGRVLVSRARSLLRPEVAAILLVGIAYLMAVHMWATPYWAVARSLGAAYYRFLREPVLVTAITGHGAALVLCAFLAYAVLRDRERPRPLWSALFLATLALYASAVLQRKGWRYHFYPAMGTSLLLLALLAAEQVQRPGSLARRLYRAVAVAVTLFLPLSLLATATARLVSPASAPPVGDPDLHRLAEVVRREAPGGGLLVLSTNMASAFPLVPLSGARWSSRFPSVWLLGAVYERELESEAPLRFRAPEGRPQLERYLLRSVTQDFVRHKPELLIVLLPGPDRWEWGTRRLDYLRFFGAEPAFARELARYDFLADVGEYRVYRRLPPDTTPEMPPAPFDAPASAAVAALRPGLHVAPPDRGTAVQAVIFLTLVTIAFRRRSLPRA